MLWMINISEHTVSCAPLTELQCVACLSGLNVFVMRFTVMSSVMSLFGVHTQTHGTVRHTEAHRHNVLKKITQKLIKTIFRLTFGLYILVHNASPHSNVQCDTYPLDVEMKCQIWI